MYLFSILLITTWVDGDLQENQSPEYQFHAAPSWDITKYCVTSITSVHHQLKHKDHDENYQTMPCQGFKISLSQIDRRNHELKILMDNHKLLPKPKNAPNNNRHSRALIVY